MFSTLIASETLSFVIPPLLIDVETIPIGKEQHYRSKLAAMHYIQAAVTVVSAVLVYFFFKEKPASPPSPTAQLPRMKWVDSFKHLSCHQDFLYLCGFVAITDSLMTSYELTMRSAFQNYGITSSSISVFSFISIPLAIGAFILSGYLAGRFHLMKFIMVFLGFAVLLTILFLILFLQTKSSVVFGIVYILLQMFANPCSSLSYESAA